MGEIAIQSKSVLPQGLQPAAPEKPGLLKKVSELPTTLYRWSCCHFGTHPEPLDALKRIDKEARKGLALAAARNVKPDVDSAKLHADFDKLINPNPTATPANPNGTGVGAVAEIPGFRVDPEVTRAIPLQTVADDIDWKKRMGDDRDNLSKKLSAFTALLQMRDRAGVPLEPDNLSIMNLVNKATESTESLWSLFINHYDKNGDMAFFGKLSAGLYYWIFYQTSLISNTIEAYLKSFIEHMIEDLTRKNSQTRSILFSKLLKNVNQFSIADKRATEDFAYGRKPGDLEDCRHRVIEEHYDSDLLGLCKSFCEKKIEQYSPDVKIFQGFHDVPILGWISRKFEELINRYIIQKYIKSSILPGVLASGVENGIQATQPHYLPFSLGIAQFLTARLEDLSQTLDSSSSSSKQPEPFPGTENLSTTIKNLISVLELEEFGTADELKKKLEAKDEKQGLDETVEKAIEKGIINAGHLLFKYLDDKAQTYELFARALERSSLLFSDKARSQELLRAEYNAELLKLERIAGEVFEKIVNSAIAKEVGLNPDGAKENGNDPNATISFDAKKAVVGETLKQIAELCTNMKGKIDRSENVKTDIASFFQWMQVFANRREIQDKMEELNPVDRDTILRLVTPLYQRAASLEGRMITLQELQDNHPSHAAVESELKAIQVCLQQMKQEFHKQPREQQNLLIQSLRQHNKEIGKYLGQNAKVPDHLDKKIDTIYKLSEKVVTEQKALEAIEILYPRRLEGEEKKGILDELLDYENGIHSPGFKPYERLIEIRKNLVHLPEAKELADLIGNGSNLSVKWDRLGDLLEGIYQNHAYLKKEHMKKLNEVLDPVSQWVEGKILYYRLLKENDHAKMKNEIKEISTEMEKLSVETRQIELFFPTPLSPEEERVAFPLGGALAPAALAGLGQLIGLGLGGPYGAMAGGTIGAGLGVAAHSRVQNFKTMLKEKRSFLGYVFANPWFLGGAAASLIHPAAPSLIGSAGGAYAGFHAKKVVKTFSKEEVTPKIMKIVDSAHALLLKQRVWKATATRFLKTVLDGK